MAGISGGSAVATIANGASLSAAIALSPDMAVVSIQMPAAWTTANLTFQGGADGVTYADLYKLDGTEYSVVAAASRYVKVPLGDLLGMAYLRVRSGTTGTPVNQGAARTLLLRTVTVYS